MEIEWKQQETQGEGKQQESAESAREQQGNDRATTAANTGKLQRN